MDAFVLLQKVFGRKALIANITFVNAIIISFDCSIGPNGMVGERASIAFLSCRVAGRFFLRFVGVTARMLAAVTADTAVPVRSG